MEPDEFAGRFSEKSREQRNVWKGTDPVFPFEMFQTEIRVPFLQSHCFWYQFQVFAAVFLLMELICANAWNGKRDSGTKFTNPECRHHLHLHVLYLAI